MRNRKASNKDLPPRMLRRVRKMKSGKLWVGYYYDGRDAEGNRQEVPPGKDLAEAKLEWARLEHKAKPKVMPTMGELFNRYERDIIPTKAPRTQRDNKYELERLRKAFADAPIEAVTPPIIAQYREIMQFQFRDIRPKAASEIEDISQASRLLGHSKEEITKRVYRRVGEIVSPTK